MSNKAISILVRLMIAVTFLIGIGICILWYPFSISLTAVGVVNETLTKSQLIEFWTQLIFYWCVSLPCFAVLIISWKMPIFKDLEALCSFKDVKRLKIISYILFADCAVFLIGNLIFLLLKWNDFALVYLAIFIVGIIIAFIFTALAHYAERAAIMREENESYI